MRKREKRSTFAGFFHMNEVCSGDEYNNLLEKCVSNFTPLESFQQKFKTNGLVRRNLQEEMEVRTPDSGFNKGIFICQNPVSCTVYYRDLLTVLREHIAKCGRHEFYHSSKTPCHLLHLLNADIGKSLPCF